MNKAILLGRIVKNPELKQTQSGTSVCNFTIAVDRKYKNQDGKRETDFIPCVAWRHTAEFIEKYFHKGERIAVEGEIRPRSWEDDQGQKRYVTEVVVSDAYFCESYSHTQNDTQTDNNSPAAVASEDEYGLPFDMD